MKQAGGCESGPDHVAGQACLCFCQAAFTLISVAPEPLPEGRASGSAPRPRSAGNWRMRTTRREMPTAPTRSTGGRAADRPGKPRNRSLSLSRPARVGGAVNRDRRTCPSGKGGLPRHASPFPGPLHPDRSRSVPHCSMAPLTAALQSDVHQVSRVSTSPHPNRGSAHE